MIYNMHIVWVSSTHEANELVDIDFNACKCVYFHMTNFPLVSLDILKYSKPYSFSRVAASSICQHLSCTCLFHVCCQRGSLQSR